MALCGRVHAGFESVVVVIDIVSAPERFKVFTSVVFLHFTFKEIALSSIGSLGSAAIATSYTGIPGAQRPQRPNPAEMVKDLFSKLDTSGKGYIEQSDLESALSGLSSASSTQGVSGVASAKEIFAQLDGDGDGKVTEDEMSASIRKLAESLDNQFNQSRMQGGMPPPPPPPPGGNGPDLSKDDLTSKLAEMGSSDSAQSNLMSKIVENFEAADTNQNGKVSFQEAMSYDQANPTSNSTSNYSVANSEKTDAQVFRQIMELLHFYGNDGQSGQNARNSRVSPLA